MAFEFACASPLKSVFVFYGRNPSLIDKISGMTASYFAVYAGEDPGIDAGLPDLAAAMFRLKKNFGMKMYAGVLHGFFNDTRQSFNKEAAEDAWKLALHHFGSTLGR